MTSIINPEIRLTGLPDVIKQASVAGYFYPDDHVELRKLLAALLNTSKPKVSPPKAMIVPHAGLVYSGPVAATGYASLLPVRDRIKRVVLLGPAHRIYLQGLAISTADRFATPLGQVRVDTELKQSVEKFSHVRLMDEAFAQEHSLEVHLPFLQTVLDEFTLLPMLVGDTPAQQVAQILESVWGGEETLIVISSDLSHFHDYATATRRDNDTARKIQTMQQEQLSPQQACGAYPVNGLLQIARQKNMKVSMLDLRNSGDTAGNRDRVVGYGAFAFYESVAIDQQHQQQLLDIAYESIEAGFKHNKPVAPALDQLAVALQQKRGVFVTLELDNTLRGCIGNTQADLPLATGTAEYAYKAAFQDPRFCRLTQSELQNIRLGISVLTPMLPVQFDSDHALLAQIQTGIDGLIIMKNGRSATFLPSVWEKLTDPEQFLLQLKQKAGIQQYQIPDAAWTYQTITFSR